MIIQPNPPASFGCDFGNSARAAKDIDKNAPFGRAEMLRYLRNNPRFRPNVTKAQRTLSISILAQ